MSDERETLRWRGVVAVALVAFAAGLLVDQASLLLFATVGVVYAAYSQVTAPPDVDLAVERALSDPTPRHDETVEVTVTVTNAGDGWLFDLRIVDGVPPIVPVVEGSPRHGAVLSPGGSTSFSYEVRAKRGKHDFEPATVVARDVAGAHETEVDASAAGATAIDCANDIDDAPLRAQTMAEVGRVMATRSGSGIEFDRTREYRPGDAIGRIDWNTYARTGDLTTIEYRKERATTVVLLVDAREPAYRGVPGESHGVADGVAAARQVVEMLSGTRSRVGIASLGREVAWLPPGAGREHTDRAQRLLASHPAFASTPPSSEPPLDEQFDELRARLPDDAQVLLLSPLNDDDVVSAARRLDARGHAVGVISPAVTDGETDGQRLAAVERRNRLSTLRSVDVPVVDWPPDKPLATAVSDHRRAGR